MLEVTRSVRDFEHNHTEPYTFKVEGAGRSRATRERILLGSLPLENKRPYFLATITPNEQVVIEEGDFFRRKNEARREFIARLDTSVRHVRKLETPA